MTNNEDLKQSDEMQAKEALEWINEWKVELDMMALHNNHDGVLETIQTALALYEKVQSGELVAVPSELGGIEAMSVATTLKGKWNKQEGEYETEKVKRIYKVMLKSAPDVNGGGE